MIAKNLNSLATISGSPRGEIQASVRLFLKILLLSSFFPIVGLSAEAVENDTPEYQSVAMQTRTKLDQCRAAIEKPEGATVSSIIELVDFPQVEVATCAATALRSLPAGEDSRKKMLSVARDLERPAVQYAAILTLVGLYGEDHQAEVFGTISWVEKNSKDRLVADLAATIVKKVGKSGS